MLVVHPHWHPRRTGVTRHVETVVQALQGAVDVRAHGSALGAQVPTVRWPEILRRARFEEVVWHAHRNLELLGGIVLRWFFPRVKVVFTRHAAERPSAYTRWLAKAADARVVLTVEGRAALPSPVAVIGHGVDPARFLPALSRDAAWKAIGLRGQRGVGVVGRIRPEKGQGDFLEAVAPLSSRHPEWTPVLVGGVKRDHLGWLDRVRAPLGDRLVLAGETDDVVRWYQALTIVVQPSHSEGFGLVLLEAMASGCCVVAAQLPHYADILEHGVNGLVYRPGDVAGLRACLERLFADPQEAERLGAAARETIRAKWTLASEANALAQLYAGASRAR